MEDQLHPACETNEFLSTFYSTERAMHHFAYRDGVLHAEQVNLDALASAVGTPFYCYSTATLARHYQIFAGGELKRARLAGIPADKIMFSGIGKTAAELALAVEEGILCVNIESEAELELLSSISASKGRTANISVRVNPDIDAKTHHKIATGKAENKFGIPISRAREVYTHAGKLKGLKVAGVDMHIGSQITELDPFGNAFALLAEFVRMLRTDGHTISHVDLGGGLGIPYRDNDEPPPHPEAYAEVVKRATRDLDCRLIFEPGRLLVGNAGILVTRVLFVKHGEAKNFVVVDAAMNDLVRPTLYDAHHEIWPVTQASSSRRIRADVVGPVCESGDFLAVDRDMVEPASGALLAVMSAGAYGAVQAGTYNTRALVPEVLVNGAEWALVRPRLEVDQLIALDRMPNWL